MTIRESVNRAGEESDGISYAPAISANGRYVAFMSLATNLVGGDTNGHWDIFVRDLIGQTTERASVLTGGGQGHSYSGRPSISADGRWIAFESRAKLVPEDNSPNYDIYVHDRKNNTTERVSVSTGGVAGNSHNQSASISADGRHVAFASLSSNLVTGDTNSAWDIFVHDRQNGTTERVSVATGGGQGNDRSHSASISADGRFVAFQSYATNLVAGDTNVEIDIFVHDRQSGGTERVSIATSGAQGNDTSWNSSISDDGRHVAFSSWASNLVTGDTNQHMDVFVHDRQLGTTERVSVDSGGVQGNANSDMPDVSSDGRFVVFESAASNLVSGDTNQAGDVFIRDRQLGITERISVNSGGAGAGGGGEAVISADGRSVAFSSWATDLVAGDTNQVGDIFLRCREGVGTNYCVSVANSTGAPADLVACGPASSASGCLTLVASPVPNQFGIFFHGASQTQTAFGNGFLCTAGGITRGALTLAASQTAVYVYNNADAMHDLSAFIGNTRNFQYWFRDPQGGGALFNTSNAISIAILP